MTTEKIEIRVDNNNTGANEPCAICQNQTSAELGPELFLGKSWAPVCYDCGLQHAPVLTRLLYNFRHYKTEADLAAGREPCYDLLDDPLRAPLIADEEMELLLSAQLEFELLRAAKRDKHLKIERDAERAAMEEDDE